MYDLKVLRRKSLFSLKVVRIQIILLKCGFDRFFCCCHLCILDYVFFEKMHCSNVLHNMISFEILMLIKIFKAV